MTLLPEVEHALLTAIRAPEPARSRRRRGQRVLGPMVTVALVSLAVAVAVGALLLLSGRHAPQAPANSPSGSGHVPSTSQTLLATLGVLRRPESGPKVDIGELPRSTFSAGGSGPNGRLSATPDVGLMRTVAVSEPTRGVALLPVRVAAKGSAPASEQLDVVIADPPVHRRGHGGIGLSPSFVQGPTPVSALRAHGVLAMPPSAPADNSGVFVVPDGVTEVQVGPGVRLNLPRHDLRSSLHIKLPKLITPCTADVSDNVAPIQLGPIRGGRGFAHKAQRVGLPVRVQTTWFAADGRIIAQPEVKTVIWVTLEPRTR